MVEVAIMLPVFLLIIGGIIYFGQAYVLKQRTLMAARYTAWKKANGQGVDQEMKDMVANIYFGGMVDNLHISGIDESDFDKEDLKTKMESLNDNQEINQQVPEEQNNNVTSIEDSAQNDNSISKDDADSDGIIGRTLSFAGISIGIKRSRVDFDYNSSFMKGKLKATLSDDCAVYNNHNPNTEADSDLLTDQVGTFDTLSK